jgi:hypothetical protein
MRTAGASAEGAAEAGAAATTGCQPAFDYPVVDLDQGDSGKVGFVAPATVQCRGSAGESQKMLGKEERRQSVSLASVVSKRRPPPAPRWVRTTR